MIISATSNIRAIIKNHPQARKVFERHGLLECGGPQGPREPLGFFAKAHGVDAETLIREVKEVIGEEDVA